MNVPLLICLMALVTFLPRIVPAFVVDRLHFGKRFERFIKLIPFTAMTALVFPSVLSAFPNRWYVGALGAAVAVLLSCLRKIPQFITVLVSVLSVMLVLLFL